MRRLPIFVCVDASESMAGGALEMVQGGLETMLLALKKDPIVIEIGALSVISFGASARVDVPLSPVLDVKIPRLRLSSGTSLGSALQLLSQEIASQVRKTTADVRGDYKPIVFLITDGQPTDEWLPVWNKFNASHHNLSIYAIGCGDDVDYSVLKQITSECYALKDMGADSFAKLFRCVSASVQNITTSIVTGALRKDNLADWAPDAVREATASDCVPLSEPRQVFFTMRCSRTRRPFLLRYRLNDNGQYVCVAAHPLGEELEGAGNSAGQIWISRLGPPHPCPYCGNQAMVACQCGSLVCHNPASIEFRCPSCGVGGTLSRGGGDFSLTRAMG